MRELDLDRRARAAEPARREHRLRRQGGRQVGLAVDPPGRGARADRALRLRQDDAAAHAQPPHRADRRARRARARSCSTARTSTTSSTPTLRSRVAMVFQQPNPFPMSIFDNVAFALREQSRKRPGRRELEPLVIDALRRAGLYDEVRDDLDRPALRLSGGQQQRLCIARAIAPRPEVLLMDEPCSALDPISTGVIEELIGELRRDLAVVIVTHNLAQAHRVADKVAFMYLGDLVEYGTTAGACSRNRARRARATTCAERSDEHAQRRDRHGAMTNLAPVPSESHTCAELLGAARRRPALLPVVRTARLARAAGVPRRARDRAPAQLGAGAVGAMPVAYAPYRGAARRSRVAASLRAAVRCPVGAAARDDRRPARRPLGDPEQQRRRGRTADHQSRRRSPARRPLPRAPRRPPPRHRRARRPSPAARPRAKKNRKRPKRRPKKRPKQRNPPKRAPAKALSTTKVTKLEKSTGKTHEKELNELDARRRSKSSERARRQRPSTDAERGRRRGRAPRGRTPRAERLDVRAAPPAPGARRARRRADVGPRWPRLRDGDPRPLPPRRARAQSRRAAGGRRAARRGAAAARDRRGRHPRPVPLLRRRAQPRRRLLLALRRAAAGRRRARRCCTAEPSAG